MDAPCSGEGMFRKNPEAILEWSSEAVIRCAARQADILDAAAKMLRPGGRLVYSTCTVLKRENEDVVKKFLAAHPEFTPEKPWAGHDALQPFAGEMTTLFPAMLGSDGFFLCKMRKRED